MVRVCSEVLCDMGAVEQLVGLLSQEHQAYHEQLMIALYQLVADNECARLECHRPDFHLKSLLVTRKHYLQGKEEFQVDDNHYLVFCLFISSAYALLHFQ